MDLPRSSREKESKDGEAPVENGASFDLAAEPGREDLSFERLLAQLETPEGGKASEVTGVFAAPERPGPKQGPLSFSPTPAPTPGRSFTPIAASSEPDSPASAEGAEELPGRAVLRQAFAPRPSSIAHPGEGAGEFTRVFTQLSTPRSSPSPILAAVAAAGMSGGLSERSNDPEVRAAERGTEASGAGTSPDPPVDGSARVDAGTGALIGAGMPSAPLGTAGPGEFTQFFEALDPTRGNGRTTAPAVVSAVQPAAAVQGQRAFSASVGELASHGPVRSPGGDAAGFTALFSSAAPARAPEGTRESLGAPPALPSAAEAPVWNAGNATGGFQGAFAAPGGSLERNRGGFTELLQALGAEGEAPPSSTSPAYPPDAEEATLQAWPAGRDTAAPPSGWPTQPSATAGGGVGKFVPGSPSPAVSASAPNSGPRPGEFTQLLQSLGGSCGASSEASASAPPSSPVFGGGSPLHGAPALGASEYTRVINNSAAREASAPAPVFAPQVSGGGSAARGLPIASAALGLPIAKVPALPKPAAPAAPAPPTRLQALMPWLLLANGILLLLLVVLVFLFLRHHG